MAESLQPAPEHEEIPVVPTLEEIVHEVNHDSSVSEVEAGSAQRQAQLLNLVSPERRSEIIAQTVPKKEDDSGQPDATAESDETDFQQAA